MRREQVLKLCLNHRLSHDIAFLPKGDTGRSFQWYAADFSEGEVHQEHFAVLFKTEDIAKDFLDAAIAAQDSLSENSIYAQADSPGQVSSASTGKFIIWYADPFIWRSVLFAHPLCYRPGVTAWM